VVDRDIFGIASQLKRNSYVYTQHHAAGANGTYLWKSTDSLPPLAAKNMSSVSIIICTRDRAESLRETLASIGRCAVPPDMTSEVVVVDNGSTDNTEAVVRSAGLTNMPVRYLLESKPGQVQARNAGLRGTASDVILFTDDDVRVPVDWLEGMCRPILEGRADALAGMVHFPPHYDALLTQEPFASRRAWFASTEDIDPVRPARMVGANMAFSRRVAEVVGEFDPELGPGALGFYDETIYVWRLKRAGFRLEAVPSVSVEHHFDRDRLTRRTLLSMARRMGESEGFIHYHWHGGEARPLRVWRAWALLVAERLRAPWNLWAKAASARELERVKQLAFWRQLQRCDGVPRKYPPAARTGATASP
jgi:glycosyltransferase involved in cell wall biosynthesis